MFRFNLSLGNSGIFKNTLFEFVLAGLIIIIASFLTILPNLIVLDNDKDGHPQIVRKSDFIIFYTDARIAVNQPQKIYDADLQKKSQSEILGIKEQNSTPYFYPPQTMLFFAPLTFLSLENAYYTWHALNILITFLLLIAFYKMGICARPWTFLIATVLLLTSYTWIAASANGQPTILMTLGLMAYVLFSRYNHMLIAASALIITAFKPQLLAAPAVYVLLLHGRQLWGSVFAVGVGIIAICMIIFGPTIWLNYFDTLSSAPALIQKENLFSSMCNVRTLALLLTHGKYFDIINLLSFCVWLAGVLIAVGLAYQVLHSSTKAQELGLALVIILSCFFSPYLFSNGLMLLSISLGILLKYSKRWVLIAVTLMLALINEAQTLLPHTMHSFFLIPTQIALSAWAASALFKLRSFKAT